jgi:hypothetical protein
MPDPPQHLPVCGAVFQTESRSSARHREYWPEGARYVPQKDLRKPHGDRPVYNLGMNRGIQSQVLSSLCTTWGQHRLAVRECLVKPCV